MKKLVLGLSFLVFSLLSSPLFSQQPAPDFTITDTHGNTYTLYSLLNSGKAVVIDMFYTTCPPCNSIAPHLETLYQDWGAGQGDVEFISLSTQTWEDNVDVAAFETMHGLSFPGAGNDGGAQTALAPYKGGDYGPFFATPTFVVIAPDGTVNFDVRGPGNAATIAAIHAAIEEALEPVITMVDTFTISGEILTVLDCDVPGTQVEYTLGDGSTEIGGLQVNYELPEGESVTIRPYYDGPVVGGISTFDLVLMSKHILGTALLGKEAQIAADVNCTGSTSVFDIVALRQYILFLSNQLPCGEFKYVTPVECEESVTIENISADQSNIDFTAIRLGDVNFSSAGCLTGGNDADYRSGDPVMKLLVDKQALEPLQKVRIPVYADQTDNLIAFQFTLEIDPAYAQILEVEVSDEMKAHQMSEANFGTRFAQKGVLTASWNEFQSFNIEKNTPLFYLHLMPVKACNISEILKITNQYTPSEAYQGDGFPLDLKFQFRNAEEAELLEEASYELAPNPADKYTNITFTLPEAAMIDLEIYNAAGKLLANQQLDLVAGTFQHSIEVERLPVGWYEIKLQSGDTLLETMRLYIQR